MDEGGRGEACIISLYLVSALNIFFAVLRPSRTSLKIPLPSLKFLHPRFQESMLKTLEMKKNV
jgi:predicted SAM-dependent methyltransferase